MTTIREILRGRSDLSAFVVHLTRGDDPEGNLKSIISGSRVEAKNPHGWNQSTLTTGGVNAVCFTETPLEFLSLLCGQINGRLVQMSEWGIAFGKYQARLLGANPVMYAQGYPNQAGGRYQPGDALTTLRNALAEHQSGTTPLSDPLRMAYETLLSLGAKMQRQGGPNEWWWEREWRRVGHFTFSPNQVAFGLCPRERVLDMEQWVDAAVGRKIRFLSPSWTIEEIIGHLAQLPEDVPPWPSPRY